MNDGTPQYTVYCGYEYDWLEGMGHLNGSKHAPQIIAADISFEHAAHLVRTLTEKGERDMVYGMLPSTLYNIVFDTIHNQHTIYRLADHERKYEPGDVLMVEREYIGDAPPDERQHVTELTHYVPLSKATPGSMVRVWVERLFQRYLDVVHEDSGLSVDPEWSNEELADHIRTALHTEPDS